MPGVEHVGRLDRLLLRENMSDEQKTRCTYPQCELHEEVCQCFLNGDGVIYQVITPSETWQDVTKERYESTRFQRRIVKLA